MAKQLLVDYSASDRKAILRAGAGEDNSEWFTLLARSLTDKGDEVSRPIDGLVILPWWSFLSIKSEIAQLRSAFGVSIELTPSAKSQLETSLGRRKGYSEAISAPRLSANEVRQKLADLGFERKLTDEQCRNVGKIVNLPAAATFSVPGAGKTTEALAIFSLKAEGGDCLLVVAPKNAFGAWDEQLVQCLGDSAGEFVRLRGGYDNIEHQLRERPRFAIISYQQLVRVTDLIAGHLSECSSFLFLDESHRIKSGRENAIPHAILSLSHLPKFKLIMSGTPMPQSVDDLLPQFEFLYPEIPVEAETVIDAIRPVFVRTTKRELDIPSPRRLVIPLEMAPGQRRLYELVRSEVARQAEQALSAQTRTALRAMGRSVMRLIQVVSNPALLPFDISYLEKEALGDALVEGDSPKLEYACKRARQLAGQDKKVLIWTTFRRNVEIMADRLSDMKAVFIHGGVDAGDEADEDSREGKIRTFHFDADCRVMVANPAAAAEGISLHTVCENAIYIDRTYNAGHYIQSEDRIHRLGIDKAPTIEIVECEDSIDQSIRARLSAKVARMAAVLDDPGLNVDPIRIDSIDVDDDETGEPGDLDYDDVRNILECLRATP